MQSLSLGATARTVPHPHSSAPRAVRAVRAGWSGKGSWPSPFVSCCTLLGTGSGLRAVHAECTREALALCDSCSGLPHLSPELTEVSKVYFAGAVSIPEAPLIGTRVALLGYVAACYVEQHCANLRTVLDGYGYVVHAIYAGLR